jgi:hypothetical protein
MTKKKGFLQGDRYMGTHTFFGAVIMWLFVNLVIFGIPCIILGLPVTIGAIAIQRLENSAMAEANPIWHVVAFFLKFLVVFLWMATMIICIWKLGGYWPSWLSWLPIGGKFSWQN